MYTFCVNHAVFIKAVNLSLQQQDKPEGLNLQATMTKAKAHFSIFGYLVYALSKGSLV